MYDRRHDARYMDQDILVTLVIKHRHVRSMEWRMVRTGSDCVASPPVAMELSR
ncbi:hypothetical protein Fraau_3008 [Frateuria aurantia DSM 6220]|uniref:Uncharacterized protein n=1 Tax=Frateuria aurantia (strain ATCC 33424 / DSM 6220 / KCTC 2777 / LMG 1558 / NBRC 3245 / NCIMB 13370) TaxID=767434 RepID=H8L2Y0_FRAAD|nr:hypothetical protein Fraau_3008 [Frateuria aurantia DSM 6220]